MWAEAKPIIKSWDQKQIKQTRDECKIWWNNLKDELQESIKKKIN